MKANEMPERIYLFDYNDAMVTPLEGDTVYIREDAFIDKAAEWLDNRGCLYIQYTEGGTSFNNKQFIEDFKKAIRL